MSVILVADEDSVYRRGLRALIEARIEQSRVVEVSAIEFAKVNVCFDLILAGAHCITQGLLGVMKQVGKVSPATRFAVVSASNVRADVLHCLSAGFHGFIYKQDSDNELIAAIDDLLSGRIYVPRWLAQDDDSKFQNRSLTNGHLNGPRLTPRQRDILPLLAQGMSSKEMARHLRIAEGTIKIHTAALLRALGARNRTEAAFLAATLVGFK